MQNNRYPTFKDSPAFKWFGRPKDDLIAAKDARIYWHYTPEPPFRVTHVAVVCFPLDKLRSLKGYKDHPVWRANGAVFNNRVCRGSSGHCISGWVRDGNVMPPPELLDGEGLCVGYSPDGDFALLRHIGFETYEDAERAVQEFAHIEECSWARSGNIDIAALVKTCTEEEIQARQIEQIEEEIRSHEYSKKEKVFDEIVNQKIANGEWVVPEGVSICGTGLLIFAGAADWHESAPVNVLQRQIEVLRKEIFGEE